MAATVESTESDLFVKEVLCKKKKKKLLQKYGSNGVIQISRKQTGGLFFWQRCAQAPEEKTENKNHHCKCCLFMYIKL